MYKFKNRKCEIVRNGKSNWKIVRGANPCPSEIYAVEEFIEFFSKMTGVVLPVEQDTAASSDYEIVIGKGSRTRSNGLDEEIDRLGKEGFVLKITEKRIIIAGDKTRGTLYGVYEFLEEKIGLPLVYTRNYIDTKKRYHNAGRRSILV